MVTLDSSIFTLALYHYGNLTCQNATLARRDGVGILIAVFEVFAARASIQLNMPHFFFLILFSDLLKTLATRVYRKTAALAAVRLSITKSSNVVEKLPLVFLERVKY